MTRFEKNGPFTTDITPSWWRGRHMFSRGELVMSVLRSMREPGGINPRQGPELLGLTVSVDIGVGGVKLIHHRFAGMGDAQVEEQRAVIQQALEAANPMAAREKEAEGRGASTSGEPAMNAARNCIETRFAFRFAHQIQAFFGKPASELTEAQLFTAMWLAEKVGIWSRKEEEKAERAKAASKSAPHFECHPSDAAGDEWSVAAVDHMSEGKIYVAVFSGPGAKERAEEYADWKNGSPRPAPKIATTASPISPLEKGITPLVTGQDGQPMFADVQDANGGDDTIRKSLMEAVKILGRGRFFAVADASVDNLMRSVLALSADAVAALERARREGDAVDAAMEQATAPLRPLTLRDTVRELLKAYSLGDIMLEVDHQLAAYADHIEAKSRGAAIDEVSAAAQDAKAIRRAFADLSWGSRVPRQLKSGS